MRDEVSTAPRHPGPKKMNFIVYCNLLTLGGESGRLGRNHRMVGARLRMGIDEKGKKKKVAEISKSKTSENKFNKKQKVVQKHSKTIRKHV